MRPIERGPIPNINGTDKIVSDYKDWRNDLLSRIGNYCCYCNMVLNDSPQVEHVTPKNPRPGQRAGDLLAWDNMLLACGPCNRAKDNNSNTVTTHYIPDYHNTHLAFDYIVIDHPTESKTKACIPIAKTNNVNSDKAKATILLCKLDSLKVNKRATDLRWKYRFEAWHSANTIWRVAWDSWGTTTPANFVPLLIDAAKSKGFFSIWFEAFNDVPTIKRTLITAFKGTHEESFDSSFNPVPRVVGDL